MGRNTTASMGDTLASSEKEYKALLEAQVRLSVIKDYIRDKEYVSRETLMILAGLDPKEKSSP